MSNKLNNTFIIQSPEGVRFSYQLAGPVSRFMAWWIDLLIILTLSVFVQQILLLLAVISSDLYSGVILLAYFIISIGYGIIMEWTRRGQTVGKKLLRIRVIDAAGLKLQGAQIILRNLLRFVDGFPIFYCLGGAVCMLNKRCQRLGDIAGGTLVIRNPRLIEPQVEKTDGGKFNSLRNYPQIIARLRQNAPQELAHIALQTLLRRKQMDSEEKALLFNDIATELKSYAAFPPETFIGLTSERIVSNFVELLYEN